MDGEGCCPVNRDKTQSFPTESHLTGIHYVQCVGRSYQWTVDNKCMLPDGTPLCLCVGWTYQSTVNNKCMLPDGSPLCPVCRVILSVNRVSNKCMLPDWNPLCLVCRVILSVKWVNNKCMLTDGTPLCLCLGQSYQSTVNSKCMLPDWNPLCSVCRVILSVNSQQQMHVTRLESTVPCVQGNPISQQSATNACYQTGIHYALCVGWSYQLTESTTNAC